MLELEGLAGAHRVGKTTLAGRLSDMEIERDFIEVSASEVFKSHGCTARDEFSPLTRLYLQEEILEAFKPSWSNKDSLLGVTDRTPLDLLAYTLYDIRKQIRTGKYELDPELRGKLSSYVEKCYSCLNSLFSAIFVIQPGIPIVDDPKSAIPNKAYINELNTMIARLAGDDMCTVPVYTLPAHVLDLDERVSYVLGSRSLYRHNDGVIDDIISRRLEEIS